MGKPLKPSGQFQEKEDLLQGEIIRVKRQSESFLRLCLFVGTFLFATLFTDVMQILSLYAVFLIHLFPGGLIVGLTHDTENTHTWLFIVAGWLIYIVISILAARVKDRRIFVVLYIGFAILLITNVTGCNLILQNMRLE